MSTSPFSPDINIISSMEVEKRNYRLDPSQYNKRGESMVAHLRGLGLPSSKIADLEGFREVYLPKRFSRVYLDNMQEGVPMLGTSTMLLTCLPEDNRIRLTKGLSTLRIRAGDILISRSGTVGTSVLCGHSFEQHVASDDCLRLRLSESIRGYVAAYLQSPIGKALLTRDGHGKVIRHLKEEDVLKFQIPLIVDSQCELINQKMISAVSCVDEAREALRRAESRLTDVLGMPKQDKSNQSFIVPSVTSGRLDPHFYDPATEAIRRWLSKVPCLPLRQIANVMMPNRFTRPLAAPHHGVPFFSSASMMRARRKPSLWISKRAQKFLNQCTVKSGMILICRSGAFGGIMGRVTLVSPAMHGVAVSEHMIRVSLFDPSLSAEYVYAFLSSYAYGYPLITAYRYGKDVPELDPGELGDIPIPVLEPGTQAEIASLVRKAFVLLDTANSLEDESQTILQEALGWDALSEEDNGQEDEPKELEEDA